MAWNSEHLVSNIHSVDCHILHPNHLDMFSVGFISIHFITTWKVNRMAFLMKL